MPEQQCKIEALVLCLNIPSGFSSDFQAQFIFQQTGLLHGMGKIQSITVLMPLICTILAWEGLNTNKAYITFYHMLSLGYIDLLSPVFTDKQIEDLTNRILELIMLHEGLYPIQESTICWHQMLDTVRHITKFGPLRCWWEMFGERSLAGIKKFVPYGGSSYDKSVLKKYSAFENEKVKNAYCFSLDDIFNTKNNAKRTQNQKKINDQINNVITISVSGDNLKYADDKFLLIKKILSKHPDFTDMKFNQFELSCLLDEFLLEVKKKCRSKSEAYHKSPIYRMYTVFHFHKQTLMFRNYSFYEFLKYCIDETTDFYKNFSRLRSDSFLKIEYLSDIQNYNEIEQDGYFIIEDIRVVKKIIVNFAPFRFSEALVFGTWMKSRGSACSELQDSEFSPTNPYNTLKNHWYNTHNISSWFKYRYHFLKCRNDDEFGFDKYQKILFGQFNYFFRVYLPGEPLLHGLPMASAVCRMPSIDKYMNTIDLKANKQRDESFVKQKVFVTLTNVFSTKLMIGARDAEKMPIKLKKNYNQITSATLVRTFSNSSPNDADDLYLLDMEPHRRTLKFDNLNENYYCFEFKIQEYKSRLK
jgi:hypothetical protein